MFLMMDHGFSVDSAKARKIRLVRVSSGAESLFSAQLACKIRPCQISIERILDNDLIAPTQFLGLRLTAIRQSHSW
ncbi:hypothetical protein CA13_16220 [Planctomycetes bacterium CA13]|uniref:Uncharacterized protein n=1 Tax=Novipirellula herctigrandis TaxID=2527986 RepID=A0A5C5YYL8_9BACT|nr:hypothetical protein CA13_16220 [Planctomycetes bacterium CA13]